MPDPSATAPVVAAPAGQEALLPQVMDLAGSVAGCIAILVIGWLVSRWLEKLAIKVIQKRDVDVALGRFLGGLVRYFVLAAAVIAALGTVGIQTTSVVALLGSAGIAIGLALQGNLAHFASGVMILFFKPFAIDDVVNTAGVTGQVTDIGLFATTMATPDGDKIVVPNGAITKGTIVNHSPLGHRRMHIPVGVAYGTDINQVRELLLPAIQATEGVLESPAPAIVMAHLGASSVDIDVQVSCKTNDYLPVMERARQSAYDALNKAGIEIPFNQLVLHNAPSE